jgi:hypothetical protein
MKLQRLTEGEIRPVNITPDVRLPERFDVEVTDAAVPHVERIVVTIESREGHPPACTRLEIEADSPDGLTLDSLRDIPVGRLVAAIARQYAYVYVSTADTDDMDWIASPDRIAMPAAMAPPSAQNLVDVAIGNPAGRRRITDALLREVGDEYRAAMTTEVGRRAPTKAIQDRWFVSSATASRWVSKARERGYLGEAEPGRPGEINDSREEAER